MKLKNFFFYSIFTLCTFGFITGILGLAVQSADYYQTSSYHLWEEYVGKANKRIGLSACIFLILSFVTLVLLFSIDYTMILFICFGVFQIIGLSLVLFIISRTTKSIYNKDIVDFVDKAPSLPSFPTLMYERRCAGTKNTSPRCTIELSQSWCCDSSLILLVYNRTLDVHPWFIGYFITIFASFFLGIISWIVFNGQLLPKKIQA